jgi:hypothetical protein
MSVTVKMPNCTPGQVVVVSLTISLASRTLPRPIHACECTR